MTELIREDDTLNQGRKKLNNAIKAFNETVVEGDSSVEAAQARVDSKGRIHTTLKQRLDSTEVEFEEKLKQKTSRNEVFLRKDGININDFDEPTRKTFLEAQGIDVNYVLGDRNVKRRNLDFGSVSPEKTNFFNKTRNLFNGEYFNSNLRRTGGSGNYLYAFSKPNPSVLGKTAIIEIEPNTTYTVKIHETDKSDTLRIAANSFVPSDNDFNVNDEFFLDTYITYQGATGLTEFTFTSGPDDNFLFVQASTNGNEPKLQVEKGSMPTPYVHPFYLKSEFLQETSIVTKSVYEELRGNIYQREYRVDKLFKSADAVVNLGDVSLVDVTDARFLKNNTSAVKMTINSPTNARIDFPLAEPIDLYNRSFALYFYLPTESTKTPRQAKFSVFAVYLTTPDGLFIIYPDSGNRRYPGWNAIIGNTFNATSTSASGESLKNITNIRIHLNVDSTVTEPYDIYLDSLVSWREIRKPTVLLEFDDALSAIYANAFPLMAERGMRGATHVITKNITTPDPSYISNEGLIRMHDVGWDICSHTVNHPYLSEITLEEAEFELEQSQKDLLNLGIKNGPQFFIAPYGDNSIEVVKLARKYYANYRMTGYRPGQTVMPVLPYAMETINAGSRGLNGVTALIDRAAEHGGHLPLMWHGEIGETWGGNLWQVGEFRDMLDYLIEKEFDVVTYSDMFPNSRIK